MADDTLNALFYFFGPSLVVLSIWLLLCVIRSISVGRRQPLAAPPCPGQVPRGALGPALHVSAPTPSHPSCRSAGSSSASSKEAKSPREIESAYDQYVLAPPGGDYYTARAALRQIGSGTR